MLIQPTLSSHTLSISPLLPCTQPIAPPRHPSAAYCPKIYFRAVGDIVRPVTNASDVHWTLAQGDARHLEWVVQTMAAFVRLAFFCLIILAFSLSRLWRHTLLSLFPVRCPRGGGTPQAPLCPPPRPVPRKKRVRTKESYKNERQRKVMSSPPTPLLQTP